ncbi:MAG: PAS domain S-box protein [Rhodospirillaceae bacterium]|nr:PAS domain S-box protein [Rhodospirillaceae bacterium]MBT5243303.1 PAS domain S-box protein [Rhodospirillaceae bacterium]MBT5563913.1 PAS domain S-box protein [Rhodospirillaceae bacterium]MBT6240883.1 PAS domain S-box protein [Rhodospirillaceae bacterium]MBT7137350.1 PAS domain S-box protein [Rhodospirillaceae bacterium]
MDTKPFPDREWLNAIISSALDCIIAIDHQGRVIEFNCAAEKTFGYKREDTLGKLLTELIIPERFHNAHKAGMEHYMKTGKRSVAGKRVEVMAVRADGREIPVELTIIPVTPGDSPIFTAYLRDMSDQKIIEDVRLEHDQEMRKMLEQTVSSVSRTIEMRDPYTSGHQQRVAQLSEAIAIKLECSEHMVEGIRIGASIHDIGKIAVPGEILNRPGRLDDLSMSLVKTHCEFGYSITKDIAFPWPISNIILQHHERLDGSGYPYGLKGDEIVREAQIVSVADMMEAIMSHRPYRPGHGLEKALSIIESQSGLTLNQYYVEACVDVFKQDNFDFKPVSENPFFALELRQNERASKLKLVSN